MLCPAGEEHAKDRNLGFNPCSISYLNGGSYIAIGGSNRKANLCTKVYYLSLHDASPKTYTRYSSRYCRPRGNVDRKKAFGDPIIYHYYYKNSVQHFTCENRKAHSLVSLPQSRPRKAAFVARGKN